MQTKPALFVAFLLLASAGQAQQAAPPLSAIDWLNQNPDATLQTAAQPLPEPPVSATGLVPEVTTTPLGDAVRRRLGLLPFSVTGLAPNIWRASDTADLERALTRALPQTIPATQELLYSLLLAETDNLPGPRDANRWLAARVDALIDMGAVDPAAVLIRQSMPERDPALFARLMTLSLLTGTEEAPCRLVANRPVLAPDDATRIYCAARAGDYNTAALLFGTSAALNVLPELQEALLARFLDPDLFEDLALPRAPVRPDALTFRLFAAAGEPLATAPLPRAFAHVDLRQEAGWKAQLEAAERLARAGSLPSNQLLGLYSNRKPAASGGIWDRVAAVQSFERALRAGDPKRVSDALPALWRGMQAAGLEVTFSELFARKLIALDLQGPAADVALRMELLSRRYESAPVPPVAPQDLRFLAGLAAGTPASELAQSPMQRKVMQAFAGDITPSTDLDGLTPDTLGLTLLRVLARASDAGRGDVAALGQTLADLRQLGLENVARRTALQMLILKDTR